MCCTDASAFDSIQAPFSAPQMASHLAMVWDLNEHLSTMSLARLRRDLRKLHYAVTLVLPVRDGMLTFCKDAGTTTTCMMRWSRAHYGHNITSFPLRDARSVLSLNFSQLAFEPCGYL